MGEDLDAVAVLELGLDLLLGVIFVHTHTEQTAQSTYQPIL